MPRTLNAIANDIKDDWNPMSYSAVPYVEAMLRLRTVDDMYGCDNAHSIVLYFLSNASSWRGDIARRVKKELKTLLDGE